MIMIAIFGLVFMLGYLVGTLFVELFKLLQRLYWDFSIERTAQGRRSIFHKRNKSKF